ncbi:MAG: YeeE/YedE family protein [Leptospira sp.]|nr:YeeE/YedE family protein [Leptospira sp.]
MKTGIFSLISGIIFGLGLGVSQMTNPYKVVNFIDLFGNWDPSLAFVMGGAMTTFLLGYKFILPKFKKALNGDIISLPDKTLLDRNLILGSAVFGIGWALAGYCPGPGITALVTLQDETIGFVVAMSLGVMIYHFIFNRKKYEDG